ncbi:hypothetical protein GCM10027169_30220 [Gordonia jinhuaensis]|uniref:Xaa-Pro dipeptidyl-peptidase C-terminal domain-containing protein n=1 Tax=Gordonia jinhuaensis TaxID=1517702 RepID=A0A916T5E4_9ACTN|nr:CocE/NonD family hydrolase [Gordonia jinhuaensis]GGB32333.1 hypothetical protein GCM10011489_20640 [Gordonia jinhuaensis]
MSKSTLHFAVPGGCDIVGDLYVPSTATASTPAPAILATNGFSGSKDDLADDANTYARHGYVFLAYSGLGFGGSGCRITFDDPTIDGKAARSLVSYLGGAPGIAFTDSAHRTAAPTLTSVRHDRTDHTGKPSQFDPRVGMLGGSYGGQIQFAAAAVDPRIDAITPMITWNDLSYSLAPNDTGTRIGVTPAVTGAVKLNWATTFAIGGVVAGLTHAEVDPARLLGCPNFSSTACSALVSALGRGAMTSDQVATLHNASAAAHLDQIRIPTLIVQGERDTLFNLNEGIANYQGLRARGVPTSMIWYSGGHSGDPAAGDVDSTDPAKGYVTGRVMNWLDHYVRGDAVSTGPGFAYFRDWVAYDGNAAPAYATSSAYEPSGSVTYRLSGSAGLTTGAPAPGSQRLRTAPLGLPTSTDKPDGLGLVNVPEADVAGTVTTWTGTPLSAPLDVVGSPTLTLRISTTAPRTADAAAMTVLFARVVDVDPSGVATTVEDLVAPARIADPSKPFTVTMPAFAHRFAPGHRVRLVISGGSTNYRGAMSSVPVTIAAGGGQTLTLPTA